MTKKIMASVRGLVISRPIHISEGGLTAGGPLDLQELRFALLFWDKLNFPFNNSVYFRSVAKPSFYKKWVSLIVNTLCYPIMGAR
jgi:hypothetical protein